MKVLHIVAGELSGGAARGALWLHFSLREKGVDSKILTSAYSSFNDKNVISINNSNFSKLSHLYKRMLERISISFYIKRKKYIFSTGLFGLNFKKTPEYKEADIIHLHWINNCMINIKELKDIDKPVVWTIRDMWSFTGGCHYSMQCEGYKYNCYYCPQLQAKKKHNLASFLLYKKINMLPKKVKIVGISQWISSQAMSSKVFRNHDVHTIPNGINCNIFSPMSKSTARKVLGINSNKKILLCGATNLKDFYKGFECYVDALAFLDRDKYLLCFFGNIDIVSLENIGFEYIRFGYLNDDLLLRIVYSSADVFIAPSIMEAFGKTLAESMSCGTPVVCFDATGPSSIVDHKINGYRARAYSSEDLACGIEWIVSTEHYQMLRDNSILKARNEFDSLVIAEKYIDLYNDLLK